jgi:putative FmdB family regulatory protein
MPLFPYHCDHCGHDEEVLEAYDHRTPKCPQCGKKWTRHIGKGVGKMYRPDYDKVQSTMKTKVTYYD